MRNPKEQLRASDADMARVLEDVIQQLSRRELLNVDGLPEPAQAKLKHRAELREQMRTGGKEDHD